MSDIRVIQIPLSAEGNADSDFARFAVLEIKKYKDNGYSLISDDVRERRQYDGDNMLVQNFILIK